VASPVVSDTDTSSHDSLPHETPTVASYVPLLWKLNVLASAKVRNSSQVYIFVALQRSVQVFLCRNVPLKGELLHQLHVELHFARDVAEFSRIQTQERERHAGVSERLSTTSSRRSSVGSVFSAATTTGGIQHEPPPPPELPQPSRSPSPTQHEEEQEINYIRIGQFQGETVLLVCGSGKVAVYFVNNLHRAPIILHNGDDALEDTSTWSVACTNNYLVAGSNAHRIGLWHTEHLNTRISISGCKHNVPCVDLSSDEHYIAAASIDCRVRIWRILPGTDSSERSPIAQLVASTRPSSQWGWFIRFISDENFVRIPNEDEFWRLRQRDERILQSSFVPLSDDDEDDVDEDDDQSEHMDNEVVEHHHRHRQQQEHNDEDLEEIDSPVSRGASTGTLFAVDDDSTAISMSPSSSRGHQGHMFSDRHFTARPTSAPPFRRTSSIMMDPDQHDTSEDGVVGNSDRASEHADPSHPDSRGMITTSGRSTPVHQHSSSTSLYSHHHIHHPGAETPSVTSQDDQTLADENVSTWTQVPSSEHEDGTSMSIVTIKSEEQHSVRLEDNTNDQFLLYCNKSTLILLSPSLNVLDEFYYRPKRLHFVPILHNLTRLVFVEYVAELNLVLLASQADTCVLVLRIAQNESGTRYRFVEERILGNDERGTMPICGMSCQLVAPLSDGTPETVVNSSPAKLYVYTLHLDQKLKIHCISANERQQGSDTELCVESILV